ncbi:MAG: hypothetical protein IT406_02810 [Candidatus Yanofskybacteria bacterium]|nr:hypothetical protein [Candidatus Yanofskybacteria bacterium]
MYRTYIVDVIEGKRVAISHGNTLIEMCSGLFVGTAGGLDIALNMLYEQHRRYLVCFTMVLLPNGERFYVTTLPLPEGKAADGSASDPSDPGAATTIQRG